MRLIYSLRMLHICCQRKEYLVNECRNVGLSSTSVEIVQRKFNDVPFSAVALRKRVFAAICCRSLAVGASLSSSSYHMAYELFHYHFASVDDDTPPPTGLFAEVTQGSSVRGRVLKHKNNTDMRFKEGVNAERWVESSTLKRGRVGSNIVTWYFVRL